MTQWVMLSGIEGNLAAYEAVLADIKRQKTWVEALYILGDVVGPTPECERLIHRVRNPKSDELEPQVCQGWWEEQSLILHGLGRIGEPVDLIERYGKSTVQALWKSVSRPSVEWMRSLDFGFFELDCLLIHGSTLGVDDELTPQTPPLQMIDRVMRMGANNLFCGRSGLAFQYQLQGGSVTTAVTTLDSVHAAQTVTTSPRQVIGVGNVGRELGKATYTLYNPYTNQLEFRTIRYGAGKGFQNSKP